MAAMTDRPRIWIDEVEVPASFSRGGISALAELSWTWGRTSIYDKNEPTTLQMQLLDPVGAFAKRALTGLKLRVVLGVNYTVFRGRINDQTAERIELEPGLHVWRVSLNAADRLAELAQAILPGPYNDPLQVEKFGPDYWTTQPPQERISDIMAQGGSSIVARIIYDDPYPTGSYWPLTRYRPYGDQQSVLEMLELLYATTPLAWVNYNDTGHQVEAGLPAESDGLELTWDGDTLDLELPSGRTVQAGDVVAPDGLTAATSIEAGIDRVHVSVPQLGPSTDYEIVDNITAKNTSRYDVDAYGRKVLLIETDVFYNHRSRGNAAWQELLAIQTRNKVNQLNHKLTLPQIQFHTGLRDYPVDVLRLALNTRSQSVPIYFPGSVFNAIERAGAAHQIIGGTVTWHGRKQWWTATCTLAPALTTYSAGVTIGQLVQIPAPTLGDYAEHITLADLGNVTQGVTV